MSASALSTAKAREKPWGADRCLP